MKILRNVLPNPAILYAFEAAARLGGYTRAAEEMGVSQASVSQSIHALESQLGVQLFARWGRGVRLTSAGERLFQDVSLGFGQIAQGIEMLRARRAPRHVTVTGSTAFATWWMAPRLGAFHAEHPNIDLRLQTADRDVDIRTERIALGVRIGDGHFPGFEAHLLAEEVIRPVCAPDYFDGSDPPCELAGLVSEKLIHLEEPFRPALEWSAWFKAHAISAPHLRGGLRMNDYALVLQAALQGQGIALGWDYLTAGLVRQNLLIEPLTTEYRTGCGVYVIHDVARPLGADATMVRDWIIGPGAQLSD